MNFLSEDEVCARKLGGASRSYRAKLTRDHGFPDGIRLPGGRKLVWQEDAIDAWILARKPAKLTPKPGLVQFWADVKAHRREHPRTVGKRRRLAKLQADREAA